MEWVSMRSVEPNPDSDTSRSKWFPKQKQNYEIFMFKLLFGGLEASPRA
jgi:hypothetical protein